MDYIEKYDNCYWRRLDYKYDIRFFDKIKNKTKNITTRHGPSSTIIASNGRFEYIEMNNFIIFLEGDIKKIVIRTHMKCNKIPLLWRKFFLNIVNNRDHIINYCSNMIDFVESGI